jgi:glycerophosphoryl diester phosphodiesterase
VAAHRAGPPSAPENTLAALEHAISGGADYAEIDVMRTRDGVVVVTHDADLMRLAGDPRRISETSFADLRTVVKRGSADIPESERRLETLEAFLVRADGRSV